MAELRIRRETEKEKRDMQIDRQSDVIKLILKERGKHSEQYGNT